MSTKKILMALNFYWIFLISFNLTAWIEIHSQPGWILQVSGTSNYLNDVYFVNEYEGYAVGRNGTIIKTTDSGINWFNLNSGVNDDLYSLWFLSPSYGWVSGTNNIILKTTDSGTSWHLFNNGLLNTSALYDIQFITDSVGWAVGHSVTIDSARARIYRTTDQGNQWFVQPYPGYEAFFLSSSFINPNEGWISGALLGVLHTSDGGSTWMSLLGQMSRCIQFIDANRGWSCGDGYLINYTTNGGQNWMTSVAGLLSPLNCSFFVSPNVGWAVGNPSDSVAKTVNGGVSWYRVPTGIESKDLHSIFFVDDSVGWAVGSEGIILKTTSGGETLTNVEYDSDLPAHFSLYQNYPNPFNPTTTIKYQLGLDGFVNLKVFNSLGEEVVELVNEFKKGGNYQLTFNAYNLPSGMYVYQLTSGGNFESRKMILMK